MEYIPFTYDGLVYRSIFAIGAVVAVRLALGAAQRRRPLAGLHRPLIGVTVGVTCAFAAYTLYVLMRQASENSAEAVCRANLQILGRALLQYGESTGRYPPALHWQRDIAPYLTPEEASRVFHCPAAHGPGGYAYNVAITGAPLTDIAAPSRVVALFDSDTDRPDATGSAADIAWSRHVGRALCVMADGHVQPCRREQTADLVRAH